MQPTDSFCDRYAGTLAIGLAIALAIASILFRVLPAIDLSVSRAFFDAATGSFPESADPALIALRQIGLKLPPLAIIFLVAIAIAGFVAPRRKLPVSRRDALWMLSSALIANGLVVNLMLKEHWGRARPRQTLDFGGDHAFTPAWAMSDGCASNCSFVSGEASSAFWLLTAACLVPALYRAPAGVVLAVLAGTIAFNRVAVGGHYLSDVVLSALITLTVAAALRVIFRPAGSGRDPVIRRLAARLRSDFSAAPDA